MRHTKSYVTGLVNYAFQGIDTAVSFLAGVMSPMPRLLLASRCTANRPSWYCVRANKVTGTFQREQCLADRGRTAVVTARAILPNVSLNGPLVRKTS